MTKFQLPNFSFAAVTAVTAASMAVSGCDRSDQVKTLGPSASASAPQQIPSSAPAPTRQETIEEMKLREPPDCQKEAKDLHDIINMGDKVTWKFNVMGKIMQEYRTPEKTVGRKVEYQIIPHIEVFGEFIGLPAGREVHFEFILKPKELHSNFIPGKNPTCAYTEGPPDPKEVNAFRRYTQYQRFVEDSKLVGSVRDRVNEVIEGYVGIFLAKRSSAVLEGKYAELIEYEENNIGMELFARYDDAALAACKSGLDCLAGKIPMQFGIRPSKLESKALRFLVNNERVEAPGTYFVPPR